MVSFSRESLIRINERMIRRRRSSARHSLDGSGVRSARDMDPKNPIIPIGFYPIQVDIVGQCNLADEAAVIDLHGYNSYGLDAAALYFRFRTWFRRGTVSADQELSVADRKLDLFRINSSKIGANAKAARTNKHVHRRLPPVLTRLQTREIDARHLISHVP
jgi:hypothetical protein